MKQICAHVDTIGEAVTALESDDNGDFFRYVVSTATTAHERSEARAILADGSISYRNAVRADINRYHSGPSPVMAENPRAIY